MIHKLFDIKVIIVAIVIIIIGQVLNAILSISSFENIYRTSLVSGYKIVADNLKRDIETRVGFGFRIDELPFINDEIQQIQNQSDNIDDIFIVYKDEGYNKIIYSTNKSYLNSNLDKILPENGFSNINIPNTIPRKDFEQNILNNITNEEQKQLLKKHFKYDETKELFVYKDLNIFKKDRISINEILTQSDYLNIPKYRTLQHKGNYFVGTPIYYNVTDLVGSVYIQFKRSVIDKEIEKMIRNDIRYILITLGISIVFLLLIHSILRVYYYNIHRVVKIQLRTLNFIVIVISLLIAQSSFTFLNNTYYGNLISSNTDDNLEDISYYTKEYIEDVFVKSRGRIDIYSLERLEDILKDIVNIVPEAKEITVADLNGTILYQADKISKRDFQKGEAPKTFIEETQNSKVQRLVGQNRVRGFLILHKDIGYIESQSFDMLIDSLTIIAVSLLFSFQLLVFGNLFVDRAHRDNPIQMKAREFEIQDPVKRKNKYRILRIVAFLFFMAEFIPLSFLPLLIKSVYESNPIIIFNMSKQVILSLPISIYLVGISITVLITGFLSQNMSVKETFYIFVSLHLVGSVFTAFAPNIVLLILARFTVGLGFGGILISGVNLVIQATTIRDRSTGFGFWFAGYSSANICAISIGGVIANRLGYSVGLLIGAFFAFLLILFITFYIKEVKPDKTHPYGKAKFKWSDLVVLFKNRTLFSLLMFSAVPTQITFIGLFTYAFPLYLSDMGVSQSNIGRLLTIYGLMLLISPVVGGLADKFKMERKFIIWGGVILGLTLLLFSIMEGVLVVVFAIISIGIADVFATSTRGSYITLAKEAKEIGESKISSIFMTFEKIFTVAAPIIAGSLITFQGYSGSIVTLGIIMLVTVILFTIFSQNLRKLHDDSNDEKINIEPKENEPANVH